MNAETKRLKEAQTRKAHWRRWGPSVPIGPRALSPRPWRSCAARREGNSTRAS